MDDDDEPITAEWWDEYIKTVPLGVWLSANTHASIEVAPGYLSLLFDGVNLELGGYELRLPAVRTRGDVRALVRLLGRE